MQSVWIPHTCGENGGHHVAAKEAILWVAVADGVLGAGDCIASIEGEVAKEFAAKVVVVQQLAVALAGCAAACMVEKLILQRNRLTMLFPSTCVFCIGSL